MGPGKFKMNIQLKSEGLKLTDKIKDIVEEKIGKDLEKHLEDFAVDMKKATVTIEKRSRWGYKSSFDMWLPGKEHIYSESINENLITSLTETRDQAIRQIEKYKDKTENKRDRK